MTLARKLRPTVWILAAVLTAAVLFCGCSSRATLPQLPSDAKPEEVVARFLEALQEKDEAAKKAVLTVEKQNLAPEPYIHGIEIHELYERLDEDAQQWKEKIVTQSEKAISMGIKTEQIAIVYADFTVEADSLKTFLGGDYQWHFILLREAEDAPWLIQDWGYGRGGI